MDGELFASGVEVIGAAVEVFGDALVNDDALDVFCDAFSAIVFCALTEALIVEVLVYGDRAGAFFQGFKEKL